MTNKDKIVFELSKFGKSILSGYENLCIQTVFAIIAFLLTPV